MSKDVFTTLGASNHSKLERVRHDYYATDPKALELLLEHEEFSLDIWEPAVGGGHLSKVLEDEGYSVRKSDLIPRFKGVEKLDFFNTEEINYYGDIITNPPFKKAQRFVEKAIEVVSEGSKVAMFLRLQFLETKSRRILFDTHPPKRVYVFSSRVACAPNGDFENVTNAVAYAWFIWEKGFKGDPIIKWIN